MSKAPKAQTLAVVLGPEKTAEVKAMILEGKPWPQITKKIQVEWKLLVDLMPESVERKLRRFKKNGFKGLGDMGVILTGDERQQVSAAMLEDFDSLVALNRMIKFQEARIELFSTTEKGMKIPMTAIEKSVQNYKELMELQINLKFKMGLIRIDPQAAPNGKASATLKVNPDGSMEASMSLSQVLDETMKVIDAHYERLKDDIPIAIGPAAES